LISIHWLHSPPFQIATLSAVTEAVSHHPVWLLPPIIFHSMSKNDKCNVCCPMFKSNLFLAILCQFVDGTALTFRSLSWAQWFRLSAAALCVYCLLICFIPCQKMVSEIFVVLCLIQFFKQILYCTTRPFRLPSWVQWFRLSAAALRACFLLLC
jgi:hypothetical protein